MKEIELHKVGLTKKLSDDHGITAFERYGSKALIQSMYANGSVLTFSAQSDPVQIFANRYRDQDIHQKIYEFPSLDVLAQQIQKSVSQHHEAAVLVIQIHGNGLNCLVAPEVVVDTESLAAAIADGITVAAVSRPLTIVLESCFAGIDSGFAQKLAMKLSSAPYPVRIYSYDNVLPPDVFKIHSSEGVVSITPGGGGWFGLDIVEHTVENGQIQTSKISSGGFKI